MQTEQNSIFFSDFASLFPQQKQQTCRFSYSFSFPLQKTNHQNDVISS